MLGVWELLHGAFLNPSGSKVWKLCLLWALGARMLCEVSFGLGFLLEVRVAVFASRLLWSCKGFYCGIQSSGREVEIWQGS